MDKTLSTLREKHTTITSNLALGIGQIILWGGSYFLLSVLSGSIMKDTGWSYQSIYGALSLSLLVSGLIMPKIGYYIQRMDKNIPLLFTGVVMACGLFVIAGSRSFSIFLIGWFIIGIAMGMGLYDALFASLGKKHGNNASISIVQVTLISSLAPSISWAFLTFLNTAYGWRLTCIFYAIILIVTILPLHYWLFTEKNTTKRNYPDQSLMMDTTTTDVANVSKPLYNWILVNFTLGAVITTGLVIHLIDILNDKNLTKTSIITIAAILGPSQAAVRVIELLLPKRSVILSAIISSSALFIGTLFLMLDSRIAGLGVLLFGMGNGMRSILRGTLPLSIFGSKNYSLIIGKLARLPLIAQAVTPIIGGIFIQQFGINGFLLFLLLLSILYILSVLMVKSYLR